MRVPQDNTPPWFENYFTEPYGTAYSEYLLNPDVAVYEAQAALDLLEQEPGARILDCPCGYGRHMDILRPLFPDIVGLDLDRDNLLRALRNAPEALVARGDMRRLPFNNNTFDAVLHLFNSFGYFDDEENERLLAEFARVMKLQGGICIDIANPQPLIDLIREKSRTQVAVHDLVLTEDWDYDEKTRRIHNESLFEVGERRELRCYDLRLYEIEELEAMIQNVGLKPCRVLGDFDGEEFAKEESSRIIMEARKP